MKTYSVKTLNGTERITGDYFRVDDGNLQVWTCLVDAAKKRSTITTMYARDYWCSILEVQPC